MTLRKYQFVADLLRDMLAQGRFQLGDRLPPERALADELSVPRSTVREALIVLEVEGLVEVRHASGIYVANLVDKPTSQSAVGMSPFEVLRARQVIESAIAATAALNASDAQISAMREALAEEQQAIEARRSSDQGDVRFHRLLAEATQNDALVASVDHLWAMRERSELWHLLHKRIVNPDYRRAWVSDHFEILEAVESRDPDGARATMWRHLSNVIRLLMELTDVDKNLPHQNGWKEIDL